MKRVLNVLSIITLILLVISITLHSCQQVQDPVAFCENKRHNARFGDDSDPPDEGLPCRKTYIYCFHNRTRLIGARYTCVGPTYFNPSLGVCLNNTKCVTSATTIVPGR